VAAIAAVVFLTVLGFGELAGWGLAAKVLNVWNIVMGSLRALLS
jgi:hypothetical protein